MKDFDGFSPAVETIPYLWHVNGPDLIDHQLKCDFPNTKGLLPCTCHSQRVRGSEWYYKWLQWQRERIDTNPLDHPIAWPETVTIGIQGHGEEPPPEEP